MNNNSTRLEGVVSTGRKSNSYILKNTEIVKNIRYISFLYTLFSCELYAHNIIQEIVEESTGQDYMYR